MADRRPLVTPGRIDEIEDADRAIVSGIVRTAAGDLTFEDPVTGPKTLAQLAAGGGGSGDVVGPASSTDNAIARFDLATGKLLQNSTVRLSDAGAIIGQTYTTITDTFAAQQDNYNATLATTDTLRVNLTGPQSLTGILAPAAGENVRLTIENVDAVDTLTLPHESASSALSSRFSCPNGVSLAVPPLSSVEVLYDPTASQRWRPIAFPAGGGGGTILGNVGAVDNRVPRADGTGTFTLQASALTVDDTGSIVVSSTSADTAYTASYTSTGANGATTRTFVGTRNPEGLVTGNPGDLYIRASGANSSTYQLKSAGSANTPWIDITAVGDVTAAANFAVDNRIVRSDGTLKGVQASGITVDDSANVTGMGTISSGAITVDSGNVTLTTGNVVLSQVGATVDGRDVSTDGSLLDSHTASTVKHLPAALGTALQQLRVNAGATAPEWFTAISGGGAPLVVELGSNFSSTSTTDAPVTGLTSIALAASSRFCIDIYGKHKVTVASDQSGSIGIELNGTSFEINQVVTVYNTSGGVLAEEASLVGSDIGATGVLSGTNNCSLHYRAFVYTNSATAFDVVWAAGTASEQATLVAGTTVVVTNLTTGGGGSGDFVGPGSSTDNALVRFDSTTGKIGQNSVVTVSDTGAATGFTTINASGAITGSNLSGTNTGDQTITLTGDVTGSGTGSFAATISTDAVTYAKMQNVSAASKLLGRGDSGAGDVQEMTIGAGLAITGTTISATGGGIGGSTGVTDNRVIRADGTGGNTIQSSTVAIDDAGAVTGVTTLTASGAISASNLSGTNTGDQTITLTGDVTGTGTGTFAATIAAGAVTLAKIVDASAANVLLGRGSAGGAGDFQELTLGSNLALAGSVLSAVGLSGTNTGDQTITLTGDVTGSGTGSFAATIANDAVTYAKLQNVSAASKLLGRGSAGGSGNAEEITVGGGLVMSATTLASTTTNYVLTANRTNTGTEEDVTDWTGISLVADKYYLLTLFCVWSNDTTGKAPPRLGVFFTNTPTNYKSSIETFPSSANWQARSIAVDIVSASVGAADTATYPLKLSVTFKANATPGTLKVRLLGATTNTVTLYEGGVLKLEQLN